jgi:hypothetical protein
MTRLRIALPGLACLHIATLQDKDPATSSMQRPSPDSNRLPESRRGRPDGAIRNLCRMRTALPRSSRTVADASTLSRQPHRSIGSIVSVPVEGPRPRMQHWRVLPTRRRRSRKPTSGCARGPETSSGPVSGTARRTSRQVSPAATVSGRSRSWGRCWRSRRCARSTSTSSSRERSRTAHVTLVHARVRDQRLISTSRTQLFMSPAAVAIAIAPPSQYRPPMLLVMVAIAPTSARQASRAAGTR